MAIDNQTARLGLKLPHVANSLSVDVERLRDSLNAIDEFAALVLPENGELNPSLFPVPTSERMVFPAEGVVTASKVVALTASGAAKAISAASFAAGSKTVLDGVTGAVTKLKTLYISGSQRHVVCYEVAGTVYAKAFKLTGNVITYGAAVVLGSVSGYPMWDVAASPSGFAFVRAGGSSYFNYATVSDLSISIGVELYSSGAVTGVYTRLFWSPADSRWYSVDPGASSTFSFRRLTLSGASFSGISAADSVTFGATNAGFVVFDQNSGNFVLVGSSGSALSTTSTIVARPFSISAAGVFTFGASNTTVSALDRLDAVYADPFSNHLLVACSTATGTTPALVVVTVVGLTLVVDVTQSSGVTVPLGINSRQANVFSLLDRDGSGYLATRKATFSPTAVTLTLGSQTTLESSAVSIGMLAYDPENDLFIDVFADPANYSYLSARAFNPEPANALSWIGIALNSAIGGENVAVAGLGGIATGLTGLTPGSWYYLAGDGGLTTTNTGYGRIGRAISSTALLVSGDGVQQ